MIERASLEELQEFANKVRKAGGGNPLDALMPAVPTDSSACLIAKNLNFNCSVGGLHGAGWQMAVTDKALRDKLADTLGLEKTLDPEHASRWYGMILPKEIGAVARDFDKVWDFIEELKYELDVAELGLDDVEDLAKSQGITLDDVKEFWPYIEESMKEAYELATIINEDGSIII